MHVPGLYACHVTAPLLTNYYVCSHACTQIGKGDLEPNDPWATPSVVIYGTNPATLNQNATGSAQVGLCRSQHYSIPLKRDPFHLDFAAVVQSSHA